MHILNGGQAPGLDCIVKSLFRVEHATMRVRNHQAVKVAFERCQVHGQIPPWAAFLMGRAQEKEKEAFRHLHWAVKVANPCSIQADVLSRVASGTFYDLFRVWMEESADPGAAFFKRILQAS